MTEPMTLTEQIARVIDPPAWGMHDYWLTYENRPDLITRAAEIVAPSLVKAGQIIPIVREEAYHD